MRRSLFRNFLVASITSAVMRVSTANAIEMEASQGSAVNFYLPSFHTCGRYSLTSPGNTLVVSVVNESYSQLGPQYNNRSTVTVANNGSVVLTMHYIGFQDNGSYLIRPSSTADSECWNKYVLSVKRNEAAAWSGWSEWNACSVTCGEGQRSRHRYCMTGDTLQRVVNYSRCAGEYFDRAYCLIQSCPIHTTQTTGVEVTTWTGWGEWSACSRSCGTGMRARRRQCRDARAIVDDTLCTGNAIEESTCDGTACVGSFGSTSTSKTTHIHHSKPSDVTTGDETVTLPLSGVVGGVSGFCILLLIIIILVLVVKVRRKRRDVNNVLPDLRNRPSSETKKYSRDGESSISQNMSTFHGYEDIDDFDVMSDVQRMSVITTDNPYVQMPRSASPRETGETTDHQYCNVQETVFVFDASNQQTVQNNSLDVGSSQNRGTYQGKKSTEDVPRHLSIDSAGYLVPGNAIKRAERRKLKYVRKQ